MPSQIDYLKKAIAEMEDSHGKDSAFVKLLREQLASFERQAKHKATDNPVSMSVGAQYSGKQR